MFEFHAELPGSLEIIKEIVDDSPKGTGIKELLDFAKYCLTLKSLNNLQEASMERSTYHRYEYPEEVYTLEEKVANKTQIMQYYLIPDLKDLGRYYATGTWKDVDFKKCFNFVPATNATFPGIPTIELDDKASINSVCIELGNMLSSGVLYTKDTMTVRVEVTN